MNSSHRGRVFSVVPAAAMATVLLLALPGAGHAAPAKDQAVIGMILEPPGLDPTSGAAAAIGEIVHYNIFEGLTKVTADGSVAPLLAQSWSVSPDFKTYTFKLRHDVKFQNGKPFTAAAVKFTFERDAGPDSKNKNKARFVNMARIEAPDPYTAVITLKQPSASLLFNLGENTAVILEPSTAANDAVEPVGTGPFKLQSWVKGASVTLVKADTYRDPAAIKLNKVVFRFIAEPAAGIAALLSGDVDAFPNFAAYEALEQIKADKRFTVREGSTQGKTLIAINNGRKPFDDVRVRRAIAYAVDRQAIIDGAMYGYGQPIGSHFAPNQPDYVDLTGLYPHDPNKARALLKEAGYPNGFETTLKLPPPAYARRGGEIVAAELAKVGIKAKIENVEWAQWLDGVYKQRNYDLTMVSHVEPEDLEIYAKKDYYFGYDSPAFDDILAKAGTTIDPKQRSEFLKQAQRKLAEDCVNAYLFVLPKVSVARSTLKGLWVNAPVFANDMTVVHWE